VEKSPFPKMTPLDGVRLGAVACGINYTDRNDLFMAELAPGTAIAGVFTRSSTAAAPVIWCRDAIGGGKVRAIVANAGNANAFTGAHGAKTVQDTVARAAKLFDCPRKQIFVASTGKIGVPFPPETIPEKLPALKRALKKDNWRVAAEAVMTTDTVPKGAVRVTEIDGAPVTIQGFGKGTQMIAPNMATTLNFLFTDAKIPAKVLQKLLSRLIDRTYNCITAEGDTSTNDSLFLCATGKAKHKPITDVADPRLRPFAVALEAVMRDIAHAIVRDATGAKKFVEITVTGAASTRAARRIGLSIASSTLVKIGLRTANPWGRMIMAVGKSGERADRDNLSMSAGGVLVATQGNLRDDYDVKRVTRHLKSDSLEFGVDVGVGRGRATVWTTDNSVGYG
jgi:glutamate N-acetyltransferase/amino-acid N-acetyltransferase